MSEYILYGDQAAKVVEWDELHDSWYEQQARARVSDRDLRENRRILADYERFLRESSGLDDDDPALD